jgi:hypothetical protein
MLNFNWWVNRKDPQGRNVFEGGFLGLDNIGVFDRSARCPPAGTSSRPTAPPGWPSTARTCWRWPSILADHDPVYEEIAFKFLEHFIWIAYAMDRIGEHQDEMWDEEDGFFYDVLRLPDGEASG